MTTEILRCRCGREVRIVRLGKSLLMLGHVSNPKQDHHPVRLAPASRAGDGQTTASSLGTAVGSKGIRRQPGTPDDQASLGSKGSSGVPLDSPAQSSTSARGVPPLASPSTTAPGGRGRT